MKEFDLLRTLMANAGRVVSRDDLIDEVWGPDYVGDTKTLDAHIRRLRRKIEVEPSSPQRIVTVREWATSTLSLLLPPPGRETR